MTALTRGTSPDVCKIFCVRISFHFPLLSWRRPSAQLRAVVAASSAERFAIKTRSVFDAARRSCDERSARRSLRVSLRAWMSSSVQKVERFFFCVAAIRSASTVCAEATKVSPHRVNSSALFILRNPCATNQLYRALSSMSHSE